MEYFKTSSRFDGAKSFEAFTNLAFLVGRLLSQCPSSLQSVYRV